MEKTTIKTNLINSEAQVLLGDMDITRFVKETQVINRVGNLVQVVVTLLGEVDLDSTVDYSAKSTAACDPHN